MPGIQYMLSEYLLIDENKLMETTNTQYYFVDDTVVIRG